MTMLLTFTIQINDHNLLQFREGTRPNWVWSEDQEYIRIAETKATSNNIEIMKTCPKTRVGDDLTATESKSKNSR